ALTARPALNSDSQWATFVRNHDELTLDKLTEDERQEVFAAFGPEAGMQVYGRGLKRRLPPMLGGDRQQLRMVYSLLFSLPGTPVLYYGEEIGMGEDLDAEGRLAVRTPMQWTAGPGAGFSRAPAGRFISPLVEGRFGPEHVNAAQARRAPDSLCNFMALLIRRYRECPELGWGRFEVLDQPVKSVLAHRCTWEDACIVLLHNLGSEPATVPLDLGGGDQRAGLPAGATLLDLLGGDVVPLSGDGTCELALPAYGYRWLRMPAAGDRRLP
ncbi:trehalose synthase, partial [Arthrobacter deserti]|nr:trehalose synthase [Arthrobacter deserti]